MIINKINYNETLLNSGKKLCIKTGSTSSPTGETEGGMVGDITASRVVTGIAACAASKSWLFIP